MRLVYNLTIKLYGFAIKAISPFNRKAKKWVVGRKNVFDRLESNISQTERLVWVHAASLGELEQGLPVIQKVRAQFPEYKILLTFFSPSGYENFKEHDLVDLVSYLPLDTPSNAQKFLSITKPQLAYFIKYEIWPNYIQELHRQNIPLVLAPAIFTTEHIYFKKPYRDFFLPLLRSINSILVQDETSRVLLNKHTIKQVKVSGDTRFERVQQIVKAPFEDELIDTFCKESFTIVAGSTWPSDEKKLVGSINKFTTLKWVIAPHEIDTKHIKDIIGLFGASKCHLYSQGLPLDAQKNILIIDNIGMLSKVYRCGNLAYVGGGFTDGIHSTVEPICYGLPLLFGPDHKAFIEPSEIIEHKIGFEVNSADDIASNIQKFIDDPTYLKETTKAALAYAESKSGASQVIMDEITRLLTHQKG